MLVKIEGTTSSDWIGKELIPNLYKTKQEKK